MGVFTRRTTVAAIVLHLTISILGQDNPSPPLAGPQPALVSMRSVDELYRIGYRDVLDVQVFRHPELAQRVSVQPNGTISLFRLEKPLVAVCKTERELSADIAAAYVEKLLNRAEVNVVVSKQESQAIGIIGAIEKPGYFFVNRRIHLLEMLAMAGGPNKDSGTRLTVVRTGSSSTCQQPGSTPNDADFALVDLKIRDVQEGKSTFWLQPGDVISVLNADVIYVYGNVNKQGPIQVREPITLTQAIVSAEGLRPATKKDRVRILRQRPGSLEREEIVFDMNQIDKGKIKDPYLEPNDIVAVSEDKLRSILLGIGSAVRNTVPNVLYRVP